MLLMTEMSESVQYIKEGKNADGNKNYFIEGIFLQGDIKNRNGRVYPKDTLRVEVARYNREYVERKRAFGELGHPQGPTINLERVSHIITELKQDGSNFIGKAKIMTETPYGKIVKNFMDEGVQLGVSSRGMGTLKQVKGIQEVQRDFFLATAGDIVADPSAPDAFVNGIMEGVEYYFDDALGRFVVQKAEQMQSNIKKMNRNQLEENKIRLFKSFINSL
jgi:hypothetical protein